MAEGVSTALLANSNSPNGVMFAKYSALPGTAAAAATIAAVANPQSRSGVRGGGGCTGPAPAAH